MFELSLVIPVLKQAPCSRSFRTAKLGGGSDPSELARIKRRCNNIYTSENETESPLKKRFVVGDLSSDEEEFQMQEGQMKEGQMQEDQMQEDQMQEGQIQEGQMQESQIQID